MGVAKPDRIKSKLDFAAIYAGRASLRDHLLTVCWRRSDRERPRLGLSVGRRHGGAVERNRMKRRLREIFRRDQDEVPEHVDLILVPRALPEPPDLTALRDSFRRLMRRLAKRIDAAPEPTAGDLR